LALSCLFVADAVAEYFEEAAVFLELKGLDQFGDEADDV